MAEPSAQPGRGGRAQLVTTLLCALLIVSGCAGPQQRAGTSAEPTITNSSPMDASGAAVGDTGTFSTTDIAWIQLLIAMDDQTQYVLELAPRGGGEPALQGWAAGVARDNRTHLTALRELLTATGVPDDNPHEGHDMPGMVNAEELKALSNATGAQFDRLLRSALREHFTHAEQLSNELRKNGSDPRVKKLAATVKSSAATHRQSMPL
ncbi:DUF305 domain-containing protein [Streptomyces sp. NBC_00038]|uniref:DUF305 domain-containing protein n=1 Tax=Streptomyces sp. NBC_00038 TaxID=2903615 RepID=UPI0022539E9C|nr:DUF305 domain-containing protein [Streptomyces sp. NBC_00038]MCX5563102.1 DUF305 domain-containing protein [Streptomyces sp. NBC_00038]